jgi:uncharacterized protein
MNSLPYLMAVAMGLSGSLHCAGMCGAIMWVVPFQIFNGWRKAAAIVLYHAGRATVYATLAVLLHSFRYLFQPSVQQYVSIAIGASLLLMGVVTFFSSKFSVALPWQGWVTRQLGKGVGARSLAGIAFAGMLNGMLPCGLTWMAISGSLTASSTSQAAGMMYLFALGTTPVLVTITLLKTKLHFGVLRRMVPAVMFTFGVLFLVRGMNLGIPYLSPKVVVQGGVVKAHCCHKQ